MSRLFEGQKNYERGDADVEMSLPDSNGRCSFCETPVDLDLLEEEITCLHCTRIVCGRCGVRQYLSEGDYVVCLECMHLG